MQKYFAWEETLSALIKTAWEQKARTRYVDKLTKLKAKGKMPAYVDQDVWDQWTAQWEGESLKKKSEQTRKNRFGETGQPSKHTGGSISYATHTERLVSIVSTNISILQYMYNFF